MDCEVGEVNPPNPPSVRNRWGRIASPQAVFAWGGRKKRSLCCEGGWVRCFENRMMISLFYLISIDISAHGKLQQIKFSHLFIQIINASGIPRVEVTAKDNGT